MKESKTIVVGHLPCKNEMRSRIYSSEGISPTLLSMSGERGYIPPPVMINNVQTMAVILKDNNMEKEKKQIELPKELQGKKFRIRKLTPTECLRLMGCDEPTIQKMTSCGLSNSALYKLAGNSIVVDVLFHLFRKMFIETEPEEVRGEPKQLSLF